MLKKQLLPIFIGFITYFTIFGFDFWANYFLQMPNIVFLPFLIITYGLAIAYIKFIYNCKQMVLKLITVVLNIALIIFILKFGFDIWKFQKGNIVFNNQSTFVMNLSNISFWIQFQSIILLLAIHSLKTMVTIDQKN